VNVFIRQLTGIRLVAAVWVLLYHSQGPLDTIGLMSLPVLPDFIRIGRLGVDLFFALSGFILAHTYLHSLGESLKAKKSIRFWWLRLARIYPVHLVMLFIAGLAIVAQSIVTGEELSRSWLTPWDFIKNLLLIQEWGGDPQRGWNFVAWSLSMEWLAYLMFPLIALVLWRMHKNLPTWALCFFWLLSLSPLVVYGLGTTDPYYTDNWGSTYRVLTAFVAGALSYLIVDRLRGSERAASISDVLAFLLPAIVVAGSVFLAWLPAAAPPITSTDPDAEPLPPYFHLTLVPILIIWIGVLALSRRGMSNFLATKIMVFGGFISYSLYMTHLVWFGLWRAGMRAVGIEGGVLYVIAVVVLLGMSFVIAYAMWRFVEEPARVRMRNWIGIRSTPTEEAGEAIAEKTDPKTAKPIDVPDRE
jgi:peptidoglycan/LPS O-acetylase OafA/YrhL